MKVLADTGYFVALFNPKDHHHPRSKRFLAGFNGQTVTTWAVFCEVSYLLHPSQQKAFFGWAAKAQELGHLLIESPPADAVAQLWALMHRYGDLPMDFCDASLVYLAQHLKISKIATTDVRDFTVYRLSGRKHFEHVLYVDGK
jgi:uncharacterized protein